MKILKSKFKKKIKWIWKKAIIRGTFLGAGSINNPENKYHLEINLSNVVNLHYIENLLIEFYINIKKIGARKQKFNLFKGWGRNSKVFSFIRC